MVLPVITMQYLAVLALIFSALALVVVVLRQRHRVPFGDGDNHDLMRAIRAHGNFAEWVPMTAAVVASLEMLGGGSGLIHGLMTALLVARVLHPVAFALPTGSSGYRAARIAGALTTWFVLTIAAVLVLMRMPATL